MQIAMEQLLSRFEKYISFDTQSAEEKMDICPSTSGQMIFARALAAELRELGLSEVTLDDYYIRCS